MGQGIPSPVRCSRLIKPSSNPRTHSGSDFKYNRGGKQPEPLLKTAQHLENLLETPPLFYLGRLLVFLLQMTDSWYLTLAWLCVASRLLHAWIHLGVNNIRHRVIAFSGGFLIMLTIWLRLRVQFF